MPPESSAIGFAVRRTRFDTKSREEVSREPGSHFFGAECSDQREDGVACSDVYAESDLLRVLTRSRA